MAVQRGCGAGRRILVLLVVLEHGSGELPLAAHDVTVENVTIRVGSADTFH
jgi:hypothetical protein